RAACGGAGRSARRVCDKAHASRAVRFAANRGRRWADYRMRVIRRAMPA
ncbi:hypothetical protein BURMUCGD2M_6733, partial [Burkholderia multivorans CGD2M]